MQLFGTDCHSCAKKSHLRSGKIILNFFVFLLIGLFVAVDFLVVLPAAFFAVVVDFFSVFFLRRGQ